MINGTISEIEDRVIVMGIGSVGNKTVSRLTDMGVEGACTIAVNNDPVNLYQINADQKILIKRKASVKSGIDLDNFIDELIAERDDELKLVDAIRYPGLFFVTFELGHLDETGFASVISELAMRIGAVTIAVVTLPFNGECENINVDDELDKLESIMDTVILVPSDELIESLKNLSVNVDEFLAVVIKGVSEVITKVGIFNHNSGDIGLLTRGSSRAMVGMGESDSNVNIIGSAYNALNSPLFDMDILNAKKALVIILGDMDLSDCQEIIEFIVDELDPDLKLLFDYQAQLDLKNIIRTIIILWK